MKNKNTLKMISLFLLLAVTVSVAAITFVGAASTVTIDAVNIATARQNMRGHGYFWDNINKVLTLDGIDIVTKEDYGLRLPGGCTVVLNGKNSIKAGKHAVSCAGNVVFKGSGSLTMSSGENGFYLISQDNTTKVRFLSGKYSVEAGNCGILSEYTDISLIGGSMDITIKNNGGRAISGRVVNLVGGAISANSPVEAAHTLNVDSVNIDIDAEESALIAKYLNIANEKIDGAEEYGGESSVHAKAVKRSHAKSFIFGDTVPGYVDFIALAAVIIAAAACIGVPILRNKKKKKALYERLADEGYIEKKQK